ncbi:hypothetical protein [Kitasatospora sp. NPDC058046]|uniref:hypothetical protein n=1 Tax=Kitasatospora sp. NPDC058046 TaxID=3346312 RepID=UPI0036DDA201
MAGRRSDARTNGSIYKLTDPRDDKIRYIGQTVNPVHERLAQHLAKPTNKGMNAWLGILYANGETPRISVLATVDKSQLDAEEQRQISEHVAAGHRLLNAPYYHTNVSDLRSDSEPASILLDHHWSPGWRARWRMRREARAQSRARRRDQVIDEFGELWDGKLFETLAETSMNKSIGHGEWWFRFLVLVPQATIRMAWLALRVLTSDSRALRRVPLLVLGIWYCYSKLRFSLMLHDFIAPLLPVQQMARFWDRYLSYGAHEFLSSCVIAAPVMGFAFSALMYTTKKMDLEAERDTEKKAAEAATSQQPRSDLDGALLYGVPRQSSMRRTRKRPAAATRPPTGAETGAP